MWATRIDDGKAGDNLRMAPPKEARDVKRISTNEPAP